jgi:hypothetical protein
MVACVSWPHGQSSGSSYNQKQNNDRLFHHIDFDNTIWLSDDAKIDRIPILFTCRLPRHTTNTCLIKTDLLEGTKFTSYSYFCTTTDENKCEQLTIHFLPNGLKISCCQ